MEGLEKILEICKQINAIPIIGKCLFCPFYKATTKIAIILNYKFPYVDYPHESVVVSLCDEHSTANVEAMKLELSCLTKKDFEVL